MTGPFGEVLPTAITQPAGATSTSAKPTNASDGTTYSYVGQHEKLTDTEATPIVGGIVQMGARVYVPGLGWFLSVDPQPDGNDNVYAYVNDPVNGFDLDGNAGIFDNIRKGVQGAAKWAWKNRDTILLVASVAMMVVPGVGPALAVARVGMMAYKAAVVVRAVNTASTIGRVAKATKAGVSIGRQLYASKTFGISSKYFGNAKHGLNGAGKLNNYSYRRIGWSHVEVGNRGYATLRYAKGYGKATKHIDIFRGPRLW